MAIMTKGVNLAWFIVFAILGLLTLTVATPDVFVFSLTNNYSSDLHYYDRARRADAQFALVSRLSSSIQIDIAEETDIKIFHQLYLRGQDSNERYFDNLVAEVADLTAFPRLEGAYPASFDEVVVTSAWVSSFGKEASYFVGRDLVASYYNDSFNLKIVGVVDFEWDIIMADTGFTDHQLDLMASTVIRQVNQSAYNTHVEVFRLSSLKQLYPTATIYRNSGYQPLSGLSLADGEAFYFHHSSSSVDKDTITSFSLNDDQFSVTGIVDFASGDIYSAISSGPAIVVNDQQFDDLTAAMRKPDGFFVPIEQKSRIIELLEDPVYDLHFNGVNYRDSVDSLRSRVNLSLLALVFLLFLLAFLFDPFDVFAMNRKSPMTPVPDGEKRRRCELVRAALNVVPLWLVSVILFSLILPFMTYSSNSQLYDADLAINLAPHLLALIALGLLFLSLAYIVARLVLALVVRVKYQGVR